MVNSYIKSGLLALVLSIGAAELKANDTAFAIIGLGGMAVGGLVVYLCMRGNKQLESVTLSGTPEDLKKFMDEHQFVPTKTVAVHIISTGQALTEHQSRIIASKQAK